MEDLLAPTTDGGVAAQVALVVAAAAVAGWLVRRNRDAVVLVVGVLVMTMALFGVRALH